MKLTDEFLIFLLNIRLGVGDINLQICKHSTIQYLFPKSLIFTRTQLYILGTIHVTVMQTLFYILNKNATTL